MTDNKKNATQVGENDVNAVDNVAEQKASAPAPEAPIEEIAPAEQVEADNADEGKAEVAPPADNLTTEDSPAAEAPAPAEEAPAAEEALPAAPAAADAADNDDATQTQPSTEAEQTTANGPTPELPSDEVLASRLREVLAEVDLSVTTEKMLRKTLETEFGMELKAKKGLIRAQVNTYLDSQTNVEPADEEEEDEEEENNARRPAKRRHRFGDILSENMSKFLGMERCARTQVVKKLWEYIKEKDLQDPKDRRRVLLDDKLKTIFPGKSVTMFSMQKHLSKHVFVADESSSEEEEEEDSEIDEEEEEEKPQAKKRRKPAAKAPAKAPAKKRARSSAAAKPNGAPPKPNGFTKPCKLSPELAAFMGSEAAPRPQITKKLWEYVKSNDLQDPSNKQFILADDTLRKLTGEERFQGFSFSKLIKGHIHGYAD